MATYTIKILSPPTGIGDSNAIQRVTLDGVEYELRFLWNARASSWYLDLYDSAGNLLMGGRRITVNLDLLGRTRPDGFPPGILWAQDSADTPTDPGLRDLGRRVALLYLEPV